TNGDPLLVDAYGHIPVITACFLFLITERDKFVQAIRRCLFSSATTPILFSDVIFADIGTSYAKIFGDVWLSLCMVIPGNSLLNAPSPDGLARWVLPTIMSDPPLLIHDMQLPLFLRYRLPRHFLSAAQRIVVVDIIDQQGEDAAKQPWHGEHRLFRLWLLAVFVNSAYSFCPPKASVNPSNELWNPLITPRRSTDVSPTDEFSSNHSSAPFHHQKGSSLTLNGMNGVVSHHAGTHPYGLRSMLLYPLTVYPLLIFLNLILRMSWSVKLSSHLHSVAEIVRRWLWSLSEVEWEVVKRVQSAPIVERVVKVEEVVYEELDTRAARG
ncbi:hypothetical protein FA13DRAFT_1745065, partial [Coprinellus micaceus]